MADPAFAGTVHPAAVATQTRSPALLEQALALALDHVVAPHDRADRWRFGPLVVVSPVEDAATAAVIAAAAARGLSLDVGVAAIHSGRSFDREIAAALAGDRLDRLAETLAARRLVVVDRIDLVTVGERRHAFLHLLEHTAARGTVWVVSTPVHPATGVGNQVDSRLCGGLVVPSAAGQTRCPAPSQAHRADAGTTPSMARIIRAAARLHDVAPPVVTGPSRSRTVAAARSLAMYLARRLTRRSLQAIGAACGGRDHSTVLHGVRVCAARIDRDPGFAAEVERLASALGAAGTDRAVEGSSPPGVGSLALGGTLRGRRRGRRLPA